MKVHCSKTHKYVGLSFDFSHANQCRVTMIDYIDEIVDAYDKALKNLIDLFTLQCCHKEEEYSKDLCSS